MSNGDWRSVIPAEVWAAHADAGYGAALRPGRRPALLVVDATVAFTGPPGVPLEEAVAHYPGACGPVAWERVPCIGRILGHARAHALPIAYTVGSNPDWIAWSGQPKHHPRTERVRADAGEVVEPLRPGPGELVLQKLRSSAFYATPLLPLLMTRGVDTVIITGGTTSGCVRATAVDAFSAGFSSIVVEDAVFDRSRLNHAVSLFELEQKYADVRTTDEVIAYLDALG